MANELLNWLRSGFNRDHSDQADYRKLSVMPLIACIVAINIRFFYKGELPDNLVQLDCFSLGLLITGHVVQKFSKPSAELQSKEMDTNPPAPLNKEPG